MTLFYIIVLNKDAGGKLFNITVDNHYTAKVLFQRKCFDQWVILLPLVKIWSKHISNYKKETAVSNGGTKLALGLIEYNKEVESKICF